MKIFMDDKQLDVDAKEFSNLEDLIYYVMTNLTPSDRLITEIKVNDVTFNEKWPGEAKVIPLDKIYKIDFLTDSINKVASTMLEDVPNLIDAINKGLLDAAELYRVADEQEANLNFVKVLSSLRDFINFITQLKRANLLNWEELEQDGISMEDHYEKLIKLMDEMLDVQEDEDWILLADLIEYELTPLMEKWKNFLSEAKDKIGK